ncbi:MAG: PaaI family thioesterase [Marmoricola sp.]
MRPPVDYTVVEMTPEELEDERVLFGGLAQSVRALAEASLRTTVAAEVVAEVQADIERLTARLRKEQIPGHFGVSLSSQGTVRGYGNAVVGLRNPIAPPLEIEKSEDGRAWSSFHLGSLYEGPPGMVHGGVVALVLDQLFGEAAAAGGSPGMTGTLNVRYEQNTPLGDCSGEAWIDHVDGVKTIVKGELRRADGEKTVSAEGIFILPRWAREALEEHQQKPPRFE